MATKTIIFSGYKSGVTTLTANVLSYDGVTTIASGLALTETAVGSCVYTATMTALSAGTVRVNILRAGTAIAGFLCDLIEAVGNYQTYDGPTPLQIMAQLFSTPYKIAVNSDGTVTAGLTLGSEVEFISPLNSTGTRMVIVKGDDYCVANGRSLSFSITNHPELIGCVAHLRFDNTVADACVSPTITSGTQIITMGDMLAAFTNTLTVCNTLKYQLRFVISSKTATIIHGTAHVYKGL